MSEGAAHLMQCMEVWGGNTPMDAGVSMSGLDAWVFCKPYEDAEGGGDVYYVTACATGRITRLLVADVSGHGSKVSHIGAELRKLMRRYVNYLDQTQFVKSLNAQFTTLADASCFATGIVCTFFGPTRHLTLCNAGHPPPLIYLSIEKRWDVLERREATNLPWGIDEICSYDQFDVKLKIGDMVLCHTDSLTEARREDGELLGVSRLLELANRLDTLHPAQITATLLNSIRDEGFRTDDDITVLLFRPNGLRSRAPFFEQLKLPVKLLTAMANALKPGGEKVPWPDLKVANVLGYLIPPLERFWGRRTPR